MAYFNDSSCDEHEMHETPIDAGCPMDNGADFAHEETDAEVEGDAANFADMDMTGDDSDAQVGNAEAMNYDEACPPMTYPAPVVSSTSRKCFDTVTGYNLEPYQTQAPYKKTVMVEKVVPTIINKQVARQVPAVKQVMQMVDEPYLKTVTMQVPSTTKVQKAFTVPATRQVTEMVKVPTVITVPVQKWVDDFKTVTKYRKVAYQVQVPTKKMVTVQEQRNSFKMEKVIKTVPYQKTETRWVDVPAMKTVTKQVPATRKVQKVVTVPTVRTVTETVKVPGVKTIQVPEQVDAMKCVTKYRRVPYTKTVEVPCGTEPQCPEAPVCPVMPTC